MRRVLPFLLSLALGAASVQAQETLRAGFRADAPPFSFREEGAADYEGFLADLCHGALPRGVYRIEHVQVTAANRFDMLRKGGAAGGVDMLCDPTSVQATVAQSFILSPLVFATGVGYLRRVRTENESPDVIVGYLQGTTSNAAVEIARARGAIATIEGGEIEERGVPTHTDGIRMICAGELEFYFGDLDILRALKARETSCEHVNDSETTTFTYEAYTLPVNADRSDVAIALQTGLYRMFSDGSVADLYTKNFKERARSDVLQAVFALNGVFPCRGVIADDPCAKLGAPPPGQ
jgi:ABC-type amino acid transport substrate-binding protein